MTWTQHPPEQLPKRQSPPPLSRLGRLRAARRPTGRGAPWAVAAAGQQRLAGRVLIGVGGSAAVSGDGYGQDSPYGDSARPAQLVTRWSRESWTPLRRRGWWRSPTFGNITSELRKDRAVSNSRRLSDTGVCEFNSPLAHTHTPSRRQSNLHLAVKEQRHEGRWFFRSAQRLVRPVAVPGRRTRCPRDRQVRPRVARPVRRPEAPRPVPAGGPPPPPGRRVGSPGADGSW